MSILKDSTKKIIFPTKQEYRKYTFHSNKKLSWPVSITKERFNELIKVEESMRDKYEEYLLTLNCADKSMAERIDVFDYDYALSDIEMDEDEDKDHNETQHAKLQSTTGTNSSWGNVLDMNFE